MVDHVKTLLLNLSAASASSFEAQIPWQIDPSFAGVDIPRSLEPFYSALFLGADDVASRARRVEAIYRLVAKPELRFAFEELDRRVSSRKGGDGAPTVFSFYSTMDPKELAIVDEALISSAANAVFSVPGGMPGTLSQAISRLSVVARSTSERVTRFAASVMALVLQLENLRLRDIGRVLS